MIDHYDIYLVWVSDNYDSLKKDINIESVKSYGCDIDMDIFHDTILKSVDAIRYSNLSVTQVLNYIFVAYKRNYIRDKQYARNYGVPLDESVDNIPYCDKSELDYQIVMSYVSCEFGEDISELYRKYVDGIPISKLEEDYGYSGLYYKFKKIQSYLKRTLKNPHSLV